MSQSSELLRRLEDGRWWSTQELLREVPCIVHSRIAELRGKGHTIVHERTGPGAAGSRYRLVLPEGELRLEGKPAASSSGSTRLLVGAQDDDPVQPLGDRAGGLPGDGERTHHAPSCAPTSSPGVPLLEKGMGPRSSAASASPGCSDHPLTEGDGDAAGLAPAGCCMTPEPGAPSVSGPVTPGFDPDSGVLPSPACSPEQLRLVA